MGFVFKSIFWLGIVYSAMPLGQLPSIEATSEVGELACGPAASTIVTHLSPQEVDSFRIGCAALTQARPQGSQLVERGPTAEEKSRPQTGSVQTLTDVDRLLPWMGGKSRAASDDQKRGWRVAGSPGYKRPAVTHPEHRTVYDRDHS